MSLWKRIATWWNKKIQFEIFPSDTTLLSMPELVPEGFETGVEILNDATTPMELVVALLREHVGLSVKEATKVMLEIHMKGGVLIPCESLLEAQKVAAGIASGANENGHQLVCRAVEA